MKSCLLALCLLAASCGNSARTTFEARLDAILDTLPATVGLAVITPCGDTITRNDTPLPTLSVFKFPLALTVLDRIPLSQPVAVTPEWLDPATYSPLRDSLPAEGGTVSVADLVRFSVSQSDNIACNILLHELGGPEVLDEYIRSLGIDGVSIRADERAMRSGPEAQRLNTARPSSICTLFDRFLKGDLLCDKHNALLRRWLEGTTTGSDKLKAGLPSGTLMGHKTGHSDRTAEGVRIAENDAGYFILPDGRIGCITVFVTDSRASDAANTAAIAAVANAAWDLCNTEKK